MCSADLTCPSAEPARHLGLGGGEAVEVVEDDEALHASAADQQVDVVARARLAAPSAVVGGDRPAQHDAARAVASWPRQALRIAPPTLSKYRSMPSGQASRRRAATSLALVVDRLVEAQLLDDPGALLGAAGDPDDLRGALDLGDLARRRAGRAGRAGDHDHVALLDPAHVGHPEVGRHAGDAEHARARSSAATPAGSVCIARSAAVGDHVVLPAGHPEQQLARLVGLARCSRRPRRRRPRGSLRRSAIGGR